MTARDRSRAAGTVRSSTEPDAGGAGAPPAAAATRRSTAGSFPTRWNRYLPYAAALLVTLAAYGIARPPELGRNERQQMAARFRFTGFELPVLAGDRARQERPVNPSLEGISAWISSVGAAVALADLDGDGLANDLCYVDTVSDRVLVAPVPGTVQRYPPFALVLDPLPFDAATMAPMGCLPGDLNEDGRIDLMLYFWGRTPVALLRRPPSPEGPAHPAPAAYRALELMPEAQRWYTNAALQADLDGDGHVDLVIGNYFPDGARILGAASEPGAEMQSSMSRAMNGGRNHFLLWSAGSDGEDPGVAYREATVDLEDWSVRGWTLALGAADLDGDLLPELYVANDFGPDRLLHNRSRPGDLRLAPVAGRRGLLTPRSKVLGEDSFKGMGVDFADLNRDGFLDIYVSNIAQEYALEESHFLFLSTGEPQAMARGLAPYVDRSETLGLARSGWSWEARLADFDNDGMAEAVQATGFVRGTRNRWPELHELAMGNDQLVSNPRSWLRVQPGDDLSGNLPNAFFVRSASGRFFDLAAEVGLAEPQVSRGIATADVDGDGDLDLAVANQWQSSRFYRNDGRQPFRSLVLDLRLPVGTPAAARAPTAGRPAVGAQAVVTLLDGTRLVAQVDGGNGHSGVRSPEIHFGLGPVADEVALRVELTWRDTTGVPRRHDLRLRPGRHTLLLAGDDSLEEVRR